MDNRSRATAAAATTPLAILAITFFLPFVRSCNATLSPLQHITQDSEHWWTALWIAPPFAAAALLAAVTAVALLRRRAPGRASWVIGLAGIATAAVGAACYATMILHDARDQPGHAFLWLALPVGALAAGAAPLFFARRRAPWTRWMHLVASFTALASPHCMWVVGHLFDAHPTESIGSGGWLYLSSIVALAGISAVGMMRPKVRA